VIGGNGVGFAVVIRKRAFFISCYLLLCLGVLHLESVHKEESIDYNHVCIHMFVEKKYNFFCTCSLDYFKISIHVHMIRV
jgi:hypothetical protein